MKPMMESATVSAAISMTKGANHVFIEQFLHAVCSLGRESELYEPHLHICLF